MTGFEFDCAFCDVTIEAADAEAVKEDAQAHLQDHDARLEEVFAVAVGGEECQNGCGYVFPTSIEDVTGFDCPNCGHDHFPAFVQQYVFWRIEET